MNKNIAYLMVVMITAVCISVAACSGEKDAPAVTAGNEATRIVSVAPVTRGTIRDKLMVTGTVAAYQRVDVAPELMAKLVELRVDEGDWVRRGEVIARLDSSQLLTQVSQMSAAVSVAEANLQTIEHQLANVETDLARIRNLYEAGVETRRNLDAMETQYRTLQSQRDLARAQIEQASSGLASAQVMRGKTVIVAPLSGVVAARHIDAGNLANPGMPIVTIEQLRPVKVEVNVPSRIIPFVTAGSTVPIMSTVYSDRAFIATIERVGTTVDARTQTVTLELVIENADLLMKPGMYIEATFLLDQRSDVVVVAKDTLVLLDGTYYAVLYDKETGTVRWQEVTLGLQETNRVEVTGGLTGGELMVVAGQNDVNDGAQVRVAEALGE